MTASTDKRKDEQKRDGVALCLSGGGYRAALFHLGALRRLNELGVLPKIRTISSVSGGSIVSAYLSATIGWPVTDRISDTEWRRFSEGLRDFTSHDIRTPAVAKRLLPWNWMNESTGVETLQKIYAAELTQQTLSQLPQHPQFVFCATDMAFGANWIFTREKIGSYLAGYSTSCADWPVAKAVAASSCFPPVFNPMPMKIKTTDLVGGRYPAGQKRDEILGDLRVTDGGVYDNLGLEPVWTTHETVLVSDGGAVFDFEADKNLIWRLSRYVAIKDHQASATRKRWLIALYNSDTKLNGAYWGIGSARSRYDEHDTLGYSKHLARAFIAEVRTDLNVFSDAEAAILQNHGYLLADKAILKHVPFLATPGTPALNPPFPEWLDPARVQKALAESRKQNPLRSIADYFLRRIGL